MKRNDESTIENIQNHWESRERGSCTTSMQRVDSNLLYKKIKSSFVYQNIFLIFVKKHIYDTKNRSEHNR
jgi:hypothetical protein